MTTVTSHDISQVEAARLREALGKPGMAVTVGEERVVLSDSVRRAVAAIVDEIATVMTSQSVGLIRT